MRLRRNEKYTLRCVTRDERWESSDAEIENSNYPVVVDYDGPPVLDFSRFDARPGDVALRVERFDWLPTE